MARPLRPELAGGVFHVTARGVGKIAIYRGEADRLKFLAGLRRAVGRHRWRCLTYCLMDNHFHLLVQTPRPNLGAGMQALNGRYAQGFNARHRRSGHLFGARFHSEPVTSDPHLFMTLACIALNPVRANLCDDPAAWRWSAHRALLGAAPADFVDVTNTLSYFHHDASQARAAYAHFVANIKRV